MSTSVGSKYEFLETTGEGAYGVVIKARHKETGALVAIKRFKESDEDQIVHKTSSRELKVLKSLRGQPFIVGFIEAFRRKQRLYLVFDFVERNMLELLEERPQGLTEPEVKRMMFTMLMAVHSCHSNGVIHRDIKPENLLVCRDGTLRLCDFGFARFYQHGATDLTDYVATRWYRSPELLLGTSDYGLASDLWAAGCIMAEIVDGQPLFPGETEVDQLRIIQRCLGPLTPWQMDVFARTARFAGESITPPARPDQPLERRFESRLSRAGFNLLKSLLVNDPERRPTITQTLQHPWFDGLAAQYFPPGFQLASIPTPTPSYGGGFAPSPPVEQPGTLHASGTHAAVPPLHVPHLTDDVPTRLAYTGSARPPTPGSNMPSTRGGGPSMLPSVVTMGLPAHTTHPQERSSRLLPPQVGSFHLGGATSLAEATRAVAAGGGQSVVAPLGAANLGVAGGVSQVSSTSGPASVMTARQQQLLGSAAAVRSGADRPYPSQPAPPSHRIHSGHRRHAPAPAPPVPPPGPTVAPPPYGHPPRHRSGSIDEGDSGVAYGRPLPLPRLSYPAHVSSLGGGAPPIQLSAGVGYKPAGGGSSHHVQHAHGGNPAPPPLVNGGAPQPLSYRPFSRGGF